MARIRADATLPNDLAARSSDPFTPLDRPAGPPSAAYRHRMNDVFVAA